MHAQQRHYFECSLFQSSVIVEHASENTPGSSSSIFKLKPPRICCHKAMEATHPASRPTVLKAHKQRDAFNANIHLEPLKYVSTNGGVSRAT